MTPILINKIRDRAAAASKPGFLRFCGALALFLELCELLARKNSSRLFQKRLAAPLRAAPSDAVALPRFDLSFLICCQI